MDARAFYCKEKWEGIDFPPVKHLLRECLELEASSQSHGERQVIARRQIDDRRLQEVGIVFAEIQLSELIRQTETTIVGDVKEVSNEADACAFVNRERNVRVQVELAVERRASQLTSSTHGHFTGVQVNRMRQELADRYA